jgi:hypothetical protein
MTTSEKVAYLKGLVDGYAVDPTTREGKLLSTIVDILEDLALEVEDLSADMDELDEGLDAVSEDLADVEEILFGDEYEDEDEEDLDDEDCDCEDCEEPVFYEAECPACGEVVTFDEGVLAQGAIECPACGENLEFELDAPEDEEE